MSLDEYWSALPNHLSDDNAISRAAIWKEVDHYRPNPPSLFDSSLDLLSRPAPTRNGDSRQAEAVLDVVVDQNPLGRRRHEHQLVSFERRTRKSHQGTRMCECRYNQATLALSHNMELPLGASVPLTSLQNKRNCFAGYDILVSRIREG